MRKIEQRLVELERAIVHLTAITTRVESPFYKDKFLCDSLIAALQEQMELKTANREAE